MEDLFVSPGMPYFVFALAGGLVAAWGAMRLQTVQTQQIGFVIARTRTPVLLGRLASGQTLGVLIALALVLMGIASGATGMAQMLWFASAAAAYLYCGVVRPRRPLVERQQVAVRLRTLTPGFISFMRVSLAGRDAPTTILERYVARADERLAPMQSVATDALVLVRDQRYRVFAALAAVARERGCLDLTTVADALALAESEGAPVESVLAAQQATMEALLDDEFQRMLKRRTLYLLGLTAISLVIGVMGNILFVMVGSTGLIPGIGPSQ